jgi:predicted  nucleic acid-binding Zn ribbon protein
VQKVSPLKKRGNNIAKSIGNFFAKKTYEVLDKARGHSFRQKDNRQLLCQNSTSRR